jgi:uncharacterized protein YkwD
MKKYIMLGVSAILFLGCEGISVSGLGSSGKSCHGAKVKIDEGQDATANNNNARAGNSGTNTGGTTKHNIPAVSDSFKQALIDAVNAVRADTQDCGAKGIFEPAPPLKWSQKLYKAAYEHTRDMALHAHVEHSGTALASDWTAQDLNLNRASKFYERVANAGYIFTKTAENVAAGTNIDTAQDVVDAWMKSDGHCANLMDKDYEEFGVSLVEYNSKYRYYWTQLFGSR